MHHVTHAKCGCRCNRFVLTVTVPVQRLLDDGISIGIVVGGAKEALDARPGTNDLTLSTRLGK